MPGRIAAFVVHGGTTSGGSIGPWRLSLDVDSAQRGALTRGTIPGRPGPVQVAPYWPVAPSQWRNRPAAKRGKPMFARCLRSVLIAAIATLLFASTAAAAKPTRDFLPAPGDFVITGGEGVCAFDVNIHFDFNKEYAIDWTTSDGDLVMELITGALKITVTNLDTDASLELNIPGPSVLRLDVDGNPILNAGVGPWLIWGQGEEGLFFYRGNFDFNTGEFDGNQIELCALLS
jgi:hypothetical protein